MFTTKIEAQDTMETTGHNSLKCERKKREKKNKRNKIEKEQTHTNTDIVRQQKKN